MCQLTSSSRLRRGDAEENLAPVLPQVQIQGGQVAVTAAPRAESVASPRPATSPKRPRGEFCTAATSLI